MSEKPTKSKFASVNIQVLVVWLCAAATIPASRFFSPTLPNLGMISSVAPLVLILAIIAFGQGMAILSGGFDLSVAPVVTLGAFLPGLLANGYMHWLPAVLIGVVACAAIGAINGLLVAHAGFPPFIVTLAIGSILASAMLGASRGAPAQPAPRQLTVLFAHGTSFAGLPLSAYLLLVVVAGGFLVQNRTGLGRSATAVGGSGRAALIAGIPVKRTLVGVYATAGVAYGIAGVLLLGYSAGTDLTIGTSWLLPSIAAVVVGGSSMSGGSGSYIGTVGGGMLLTLLSTDINALGISEGWKQVLYGAIIAIALILSRLSKGGR
ncbi:MAG: ABC transporter permease [Micrococcales bacterium]|nr:ABC transporter permease [Micrococcales bacterium]